jgi:hypothetical protein
MTSTLATFIGPVAFMLVVGWVVWRWVERSVGEAIWTDDGRYACDDCEETFNLFGTGRTCPECGSPNVGLPCAHCDAVVDMWRQVPDYVGRTDRIINVCPACGEEQ